MKPIVILLIASLFHTAVAIACAMYWVTWQCSAGDGFEWAYSHYECRRV